MATQSGEAMVNNHPGRRQGPPSGGRTVLGGGYFVLLVPDVGSTRLVGPFPSWGDAHAWRDRHGSDQLPLGGMAEVLTPVTPEAL